MARLERCTGPMVCHPALSVMKIHSGLLLGLCPGKASTASLALPGRPFSERVPVSAVSSVALWPAAPLRAGVVQEVLPRSSELGDPPVANVDHILLVFSLSQPPFEPAQVSRFLVLAESTAVPVTLALNKADLVPPAVAERVQAQVCARGGGWGGRPAAHGGHTDRQSMWKTLGPVWPDGQIDRGPGPQMHCGGRAG
jgi:RsgA GTPase